MVRVSTNKTTAWFLVYVHLGWDLIVINTDVSLKL